MSLFKRGSVWWSYFYKDGVRYQSSTGTSNRREAETIQGKFKEEINKRQLGMVASDPKMTFGELAARFIASSSIRPHHIHHLGQLLPYFERVLVLKITKAMADDFRAKRMAAKAIKDATVNRDLSVLRHILYWAVDELLLATNPLARMKMARERRTRRQVLSIAEEDLLLKVAPDHLRAMTIAALDTGMRRGEITSQRWEDIDFSQRLLFVTRSKTPEGESRAIPLTDRLHKLLLVGRRPEGNVFGYHGVAVRIIKRSWKTALKNAGIRHMRFHDLRHTFNTRLMEAGVVQDIRMALMGHSSGGSRMQGTYTHIELPTKRKAMEQLEVWVKAQRTEQVSSTEIQKKIVQTTRTASDPHRNDEMFAVTEDTPKRTSRSLSHRQLRSLFSVVGGMYDRPYERKSEKENANASTETERAETRDTIQTRGEEAMEEKVAHRGGDGPGRKIEGGDR